MLFGKVYARSVKQEDKENIIGSKKDFVLEVNTEN
jgi:hypothetical protein